MYRPFCMLDTAGRCLKRLLKPVSDSSYPKCRRSSWQTIPVLERVINSWGSRRSCENFPFPCDSYSRRIVLLAIMNVGNAFNSARCSEKLKALDHFFWILQYLLRIMDCYMLPPVLLICGTTYGPRRKEITIWGCPGLILGSDLWNIFYSGMLWIKCYQTLFWRVMLMISW